VILAGAYNLASLTQSAEVLDLIKSAYASAAVCVAFVFTLGIEHRNVKAEGKKRSQEAIEVKSVQNV
jgi:hypothetical protein